MEYARRVKAQDPGKVGANLVPITGTPSNCARMFLQSNSTNYDTFYKDTDGVYKWGAAAPETLEGLKLWYEAYSTGLLDREFYLLKSEEDRNKFEMTLRAGGVFEQLPTAEVQARRVGFANNTGLNADDCVHFATLLGMDGNYHQRDLINFWGTICFSPKVPTAVFERWMDVMDYASTEEGYAMTVMGLPGVDFRKDGNEYISLLPPGVELAGDPGQAKYPSMGYILGSVKLWDDFAFDNPNIEKKYRDESRVLYAERCKIATPLTFIKVDWDLYTYDSPARRRATSYNYPNEFANMITNATSARNLEDIWRTWINEQNSIIQPVLNELNALKR